MRKVLIFGSTDFAEVACAYLEADERFTVAAFTVHAAHLTTRELSGHDVVPFESIEERFPPGEYSMFVAIGYSGLNQSRATNYRAAKAKGYSMITYVHPSVRPVGPFSIGENSFVLEANVIQPFATIGDNVVIWSGTHIGHHVTIGNHCFLSSHVVVAGRAAIGEGCFVGANATIRDGVTVAPRCIIGAVALIMRDTREGEVYRAVPTSPASYPSHRWKI